MASTSAGATDVVAFAAADAFAGFEEPPDNCSQHGYFKQVFHSASFFVLSGRGDLNNRPQLQAVSFLQRRAKTVEFLQVAACRCPSEYRDCDSLTPPPTTAAACRTSTSTVTFSAARSWRRRVMPLHEPGHDRGSNNQDKDEFHGWSPIFHGGAFTLHSPASRFNDVSKSTGKRRSQRVNWWTMSPAAMLAA